MQNQNYKEIDQYFLTLRSSFLESGSNCLEARNSSTPLVSDMVSNAHDNSAR